MEPLIDVTLAEQQRPIEPLPKQIGTGPTGKAALAAGAAALNVWVPGITVPEAGVTAALQALGDKLSKQQEARLFELRESASLVTELPVEEVVHQLTAREDLVLLAAEAIDVARRSRLSGKATAPGRCLGNMLNDDARIDTESIWLRIIAVVEPPHLWLLKSVMDSTGPDGVRERRKNAAGTGQPGRNTASLADVGRSLGLEGAASLPLLQDLVSCGLVFTDDIRHMRWTILEVIDQEIYVTLLAPQLLRRLAQAASAE